MNAADADRQIKDLAGFVALLAEAIADGRIPGGPQRYATSRLLAENAVTLRAWTEKEKS
jgi:hypothetical protein